MRRLLCCLLLLAGCAAPQKGLTLATWGSLEEVETLKQVLADFRRAHPAVPVELIHIPDNYFQKLHLLIASGNTPDVIFTNNWQLPVYAEHGVLRDMAQFQPEFSHFHPQAVEAMRYRGKVYALPRDLSNLVLYYNQERFQDRGVPLPHHWRFDDVIRYGKQLVGAEQWAISFDPRPLFWLPYLWSGGGELFDSELTRTRLAEPASVAALQFYADLRHKHHLAPSLIEQGGATPAQLFAQGKLAMFVSGRWSVPAFQKLPFKWGVAAFPEGPGGSVVDADASGWAISRACQDPDDAWQLVQFLAGKSAASRFAASGLIIPARRDVPFEGGDVFVKALATGRPIRTPANWNEVQQAIDKGLEPLWRGEKSAAEVVPALAKRVDLLL